MCGFCLTEQERDHLLLASALGDEESRVERARDGKAPCECELHVKLRRDIAKRVRREVLD